MECKKCGKRIDELDIYCDDCKELLKKEKELDKLIVENKELNKLEITKEVETLTNFKDEKKKDSLSLKEELKDIVNIEEIETQSEDANKKIIIIVVCIFIVMLVTILVILLILFNKKETEPVDEPEIVDYEKIINDYGDAASLTVSNYLKINEELPSWSVISDLIQYDDYEVVCDIHRIYEGGTIYLNECKIDDETVRYSYGIEQEEIKEGKKIEIYRNSSSNNSYSYSSNNQQNSELVGFITCKTEECEYISGYSKYTLIKENNEYYVYNYETNSIEFGPFNAISEYAENNVLVYEHELYGVLYEEDGKQNIYNLNTEKTLKNLEGELLLSGPNFTTNIMYKYGYVILKTGHKNSFVNLKTGNVSYIIDGNLNTFIEDTTKNLVYITTLNSQNSKITVYNSNGKKLFDGREYDNIYLNNGSLIVTNQNNFYVYNSELKLKVTSKEYDNILNLYSDFIVVVDEQYLKITDFYDNELAKFEFKWDNEKYSLDSNLSGWSTDTEIKLIIANKETNKFIECYYNTVTKESKVKEVTN